MPPVEGSLRGRPRPAGSAAAAPPPDELLEDEALGPEPQGGVLEDAEERRHKTMNPTTRKQTCRQHKDVVVKRHKLRTAPVLTPCWRCLQEAKVRAEEAQKAAEARVDFLHRALQEEKEHGVVLERRAAAVEEEQLGLRHQIAKLVEQVAGLSEELSRSLDANKRLADQQRSRAILMGGGGGATSPTPSTTSSVASSSPSPTPLSSSSIPQPKPPAAAAQPSPAAATGSSTTIQELVSRAEGGPAGPAPSKPKPPVVDVAAANAEGVVEQQQQRPMSPVPQALGASGPSRIFQALKEQEAASAVHEPAAGPAEVVTAGPVQSSPGGAKTTQHKKRWSLFHHKKSQQPHVVEPEEEPAGECPAGLPTVDEVDEPLSVDLLAKKLLRMVDARPECLERIYRKSEMLEEWRMEVQLGLTFDLDEEALNQSMDKDGSKEPSRPYRMEPSASCLFEDQMELVGALTNHIRTAVLRHVADCCRLAKSDPDVLRQALSVVRLHEDFQRRKLEGAKSKLQGHCTRQGTDELKDLDTVLKLCALEDWDSEVRLTLKEAAALRALEVFSVAHMEAAGSLDVAATGGLSREGAMVAAADALVEDLKNVLETVVPFFAPEHRAASFFVGQYDAHISRQVAALHEHGLSDLELGDLFEVNRFLQDYKEEIVALGAPAPRPELASAATACLQECMVKTRQQMSAWYESILGRASEALVDGDGRPFTANPEDLFQIIHTQVRVAADAGGFKGDDLCALLVVILNALKEFVAEHHARLQRQRALDEPALGALQLCAVVNDYERLYDKATELRDALLGKGQLDPDKHFDVLDHVLDQLHDEQARVSFEATRLVSYIVLRDASASLLEASPFDDPDGKPLSAAASWAAWDQFPLGGNGVAAAAAAAALVEKAKQQQRQKEVAQRMARVDVLKDARLTVKDYFGDLQTWLPDYFFSHVVRACLEGLIVLYIASVLRGRTLFGDLERAHQRLRRDKQGLIDDFAPYAQQLEEQGIPDVLVPFGPWDDLMEVILKGGEPRAPWTGYLLRTLPPPWNVDAVLQVRALRGEGLEKKAARQEARGSLLDWYRAEIAGDGKGAGGGGRDVAWRLKTSPLAVRPGSKKAVALVKECVYNA